MSETEEKKMEQATAEEFGKPVEAVKDECAGIEDPVRRGLCQVCQKPIIGAAPFCQDHEPPVP